MNSEISVCICEVDFLQASTMGTGRAAPSPSPGEMLVACARLAGATEAEAEASVALPKLTLHVMDVGLDDVKDPVEPGRFMNMPTTFVLPADDVDRLREIAGRLLRESTDHQLLQRE